MSSRCLALSSKPADMCAGVGAVLCRDGSVQSLPLLKVSMTVTATLKSGSDSRYHVSKDFADFNLKSLPLFERCFGLYLDSRGHFCDWTLLSIFLASVTTTFLDWTLPLFEAKFRLCMKAPLRR